jgi:ribosomal protein S18 acetylase RimI-like enzyme
LHSDPAPFPFSITELTLDHFAEFAAYLNDHLRDNGGRDTGYFQPLPRHASVFMPEHATVFQNGLMTQVGRSGWRRLWVARDAQGKLAGHVDLRARPDRYSEHRCLLGLGVDRNCRGQGLGRRLIEHARDWAAEIGLAYIDLQVLSSNHKAMALYERTGFVRVGETADMFRIDGRGFDYTTMTLPLAGKAENV